MSEGSICNHCGQAAGSVFVHGHYQCLACHSVQIPCCEGAADSCLSPDSARSKANRQIRPAR